MAANSQDDEAALFRYGGPDNSVWLSRRIWCRLKMAIGWRQPLRELDSHQDVGEVPFLRLAATDKDGRHDSQYDEHFGWNITDQTTLQPYGECRYVIELGFGQAVSIDLVTTGPITVLVCDDDDYDCFQNRKSCFDRRAEVTNVVAARTNHQIKFRAASTGVYDVVVCNLDGDFADVTVQIIAARPNHSDKERPSREPRAEHPFCPGNSKGESFGDDDDFVVVPKR